MQLTGNRKGVVEEYLLLHGRARRCSRERPRGFSGIVGEALRFLFGPVKRLRGSTEHRKAKPRRIQNTVVIVAAAVLICALSVASLLQKPTVPAEDVS